MITPERSTPEPRRRPAQVSGSISAFRLLRRLRLRLQRLEQNRSPHQSPSERETTRDFRPVEIAIENRRISGSPAIRGFTNVSIPLPDSERERLQQQYAEIATLAGGLAHEIRNPLSTIRMNLELLGEDLEESDDPILHRSLKKLARIRQECTHLEDILSAFLKFARAGQLDLERVDLAEVVTEFVDFYRPQAAEYKVELSPHLAGNLPPVSIDRSLMKQVFMNLALNAQQAMPDGGEITIQVFADGPTVRLEIIDTGTGMSPRAKDSMFQVFFSTKPGGSGLGLPTVRKIIEAHGGDIRCDSEPGRGTRFTITLPAHTDQ